MVLSQGACARASADIMVYKKTINSNSFHGLVPRRYYDIQKTINSTSFHGLVPRRYYDIQITINSNSFHDIMAYKNYKL